jgi:hypothetical protein
MKMGRLSFIELGRALLWDKLPQLSDSGDSAGKENAMRQRVVRLLQ